MACGSELLEIALLGQAALAVAVLIVAVGRARISFAVAKSIESTPTTADLRLRNSTRSTSLDRNVPERDEHGGRRTVDSSVRPCGESTRLAARDHEKARSLPVVGVQPDV